MVFYQGLLAAWLRQTKWILAFMVVIAVSHPVSAATVSGGSFVINLDREDLAAAVDLDATEAPSMYLEEFFDAEASKVRTYNQILEEHLVPGVVEIPATGLVYAVNGAQVINLQGRNSKTTTISFDPNNFAATVQGRVGLAGVMRYRLDIDSPFNRILSGDYSLEYNVANADANSGRSAWTLYNHVSFRSESFNLFNVVMGLDGGSLTLNGDLGVGAGFEHFQGTPGALVGTFSLQTAVVPVPASAALFAMGLAGAAGLGRTRRGR